MALSRSDLIQRIAVRYGHYQRGTATGGSAVTIVDTAALYQPNDVWVGKLAYILTDAGSVAPQGEERPITGFAQATSTITVDPAFSAAVAATDVYEIFSIARSSIVLAINTAIADAGATWPVHLIDETIPIVADDYDYTLPTDVVKLLRVESRGGVDEPYVTVPARMWRVSGTPGSQELLFDSLNGLAAGDTLRLEYTACLTELATDASTLNIGEPAEMELTNFLVERALYWLHSISLSTQPSSSEEAKSRWTLAESCYAKSENIRNRVLSRKQPGTIRTKLWSRGRG